MTAALMLLVSACQPADKQATGGADGAVQNTDQSDVDVVDTSKLPAEIVGFYEVLQQAQDFYTLEKAMRDNFSDGFHLVTLQGQKMPLTGLLNTTEEFQRGVQDYEAKIDFKSTDISDNIINIKYITTSKHSSVSTLIDGRKIADKSSNEDSYHDVWEKIDGSWKMKSSHYLSSSRKTPQGSHSITADTPPDEATATKRKQALTEVSIPIRTLAFDGNSDDLAWLHEYADTSSIIGLGEGSHGTEEHFRFKVRMFQTLAEKKSSEPVALLMEGSPDFILPVNRWLLGENDEDLAELLQKAGYNFVGKSFFDLLTWMKEQNLAGRKYPLQIWGIDARFPSSITAEIDKLLPHGKAKEYSEVLKTFSSWQDLTINPEEYQPSVERMNNMIAEIKKLPDDTPNITEIRYLSRVLE